MAYTLSDIPAGIALIPALRADPAVVPATRSAIDALTGIRALAAFWVVLFHFRAELTTLLPALRPVLPFATAGRLGVDLFFVLSGFILAYNYVGTVRLRGYGRFLWLRLARIYPVHLVTLVILVVAVIGMRTVGRSPNPASMYTAEAVLTNLLMVNAWTGMELTWNYPAWSISAEWFAYLLFPFLALGLARLRSARVALLLAAASLATMFAVFLAFPTGWPFPAPLVRIGAEFVAGALLCHVYRSTLGRTWRWGTIAAGLTVAVVVGATWLEATGRNSIWVTPLLAALIVAVARADSGPGNWLARPTMVYFGQVSYALYMTHGIGQLILVRLLPPHAFGGSNVALRVGIVVVYVVALLAAAIAMFRYVEEPGRHWMRRRVDRESDATVQGGLSR
jgi:peptidoglycan/LPS O-acetylase OafA/YrhL